MERRATGHTGLTWITVISGELALTAGTSFGLSGTVSNLTPRISSSLVLPVTNPCNVAISVTSVTVSVPAIPSYCSAANLTLRDGAFGGTPPAASMTGLSQVTHAGTVTTVTVLTSHPDPSLLGRPVTLTTTVSARPRATRRPAGRSTVAQGRSDCIKRPGRVASPVIVDPREGNIIKSGVLLGRKSDGFAAAGSQSSGTATFWRNTGMGSYWLDAAAEIKGNRIRGSLSCRNNHPAPTNGGHHSTVPGHRRGQCAAAAGL